MDDAYSPDPPSRHVTVCMNDAGRECSRPAACQGDGQCTDPDGFAAASDIIAAQRPAGVTPAWCGLGGHPGAKEPHAPHAWTHGTDHRMCAGLDPKPPDYLWTTDRGIRVMTHYVNHGGTWQGADGGEPTAQQLNALEWPNRGKVQTTLDLKTSNAEGEGVPSVVPMDTPGSSGPHEGQPDGCLSPDTPLTDQAQEADDAGVKFCTTHTKPVVGKRRLDGVSPMPNGGVYPLGGQPLADVVAHAEKDTDRRHKAQHMTVTAQIVDDRQRIVAIVVDGQRVDA